MMIGCVAKARICLMNIIMHNSDIQQARVPPKSKKSRPRRRKRFRLRIFRRPRQKSQQNLKSLQCDKIIELKTCEACGCQQQDQKMLLCDECDDAYHWPCLGLKEFNLGEEIWLCPTCQNQEDKEKAVQMRDRNSAPDQCSKCGQGADYGTDLIFRRGDEPGKLKIKEGGFLICLQCKHYFHAACFSQRLNSLNCWDCENKIRKQGPKNHEQFLKFLRNQLVQVHKKGFFELTKESKSSSKTKRTSLMGLKLFEELTDCLYYALKSRGLIFTDQQVYSSEQIMALNNSDKQVIGVHSLHIEDQKVFQFFKAKIRRGAVVPLQIRQNREFGFHILALSYIEKGTILCQYTGEVISQRDSLIEKQHDSIFTLLMSGSSKGDLNIVPKLFGNLSMFFNGVNNYERDHLKKVNVRSVRFSHCKRMRVIFVAKRPIEMGEPLYLDYNAGTYEEYPTYNFI